MSEVPKEVMKMVTNNVTEIKINVFVSSGIQIISTPMKIAKTASPLKRVLFGNNPKTSGARVTKMTGKIRKSLPIGS